MDHETKSFKREIAEVTEFFVTDDNEAKSNTIYRKTSTGNVIRNNPTKYVIDYLDAQGVTIPSNMFIPVEDTKEVESLNF